MLGEHYLAKASGCARARLVDPVLASGLLTALADALDLTAIGEPMVHRHPDDTVVGVLLLSESHAAIHTLPDGGVALVDVFSCRPFDAHLATRVLSEWLEPDTLDEQRVQR